MCRRIIRRCRSRHPLRRGNRRRGLNDGASFTLCNWRTRFRFDSRFDFATAGRAFNPTRPHLSGSASRRRGKCGYAFDGGGAFFAQCQTQSMCGLGVFTSSHRHRGRYGGLDRWGYAGQAREFGRGASDASTAGRTDPFGADQCLDPTRAALSRVGFYGSERGDFLYPDRATNRIVSRKNSTSRQSGCIRGTGVSRRNHRKNRGIA